MQVNLLMSPFEAFDLYKDLPEVYIPMLWFRERAEITPELADLLNLVLFTQTLAPAILYSLAVIGILMLCSGLIVRKIKKTRYNL